MTWVAASRLDRLPAARGEDQLDAYWERANVLLLGPDGAIAAEGGGPRLGVPGARQPGDLFLGQAQGRFWFVRPVPEVEGDRLTWREVGEDDQHVFAAAVALTRWHATAPACESCGRPTVVAAGGAHRHCPACGALLFPRTDPCVIVAITDPDDRLLLARQRAWPAGRCSIIAGFMEAGESAEQAVHREAREEVGVTLAGLSYVGSQPWPMPRSLMLGFEARATDSRIRVDGDEIAEGAYYTREALLAAVAEGEISLPGKSSIARQLIERWLSRG